jgi:uncharacterized OsmC-like protein
MENFKKIQSAFNRQSEVLNLRSGMGIGTAVTKVRVKDGLTCDIEEGKWKLTADMNPKWGGNDAGPNPGIFGRGALGSCLAMGYMMWAAKLGIDIKVLEVEIHADYDTRGMCGIGDATAGYKGVKYVVNISSDSPEDEVIKFLDKADMHSSYLDVFSRSIELQREVKLIATKETVETNGT